MKRILIAEDSRVVASVTERILSTRNYEADSARNGEEVMEKMRQREDYDLILMDIHMPVMGGIQCAKAIREAYENKKYGAIPIIAITGNSLNYTKEDYRVRGIDDVLEKPIDYDLLMDRIAERTAE